MLRGVFYCCRLVKKKTIHNVAVFFCPRDGTIHEGKIHSDDELARITKVVNKKDTDIYRQKKCYFLWFLVLTRWIFLSTCGLGKFQIPSNFAESSWSSGCGLNLCHHTNYIFTQPKKQQERKNFLRNKIQLTKIDLTWTKISLFSVHLFSV